MRRRLTQQEQQVPSWAQSDWVIATSDDSIGSGIKRACADCGEDAYTSVRYPDDVAIVCDVCTYDRLIGKEAAHS
jgi:formylmethanofuran dehydrogenase subunit E